MAKKTGSEGLLAEIGKYAPPNRNWFQLLTPELQKDVLEVRRQYKQGGFPYSAKVVWEWLKKEHKVKVGRDTVRLWLGSDDESK